jgi:hypothetical protein
MLTLLQVSLYNARMRQIHLVRCIGYCADIFLWGNLTAGGILLMMIANTIVFKGASGMRAWWNDDQFIIAACAWIVAVACFVFCYRLIIAFKKYLHFAHPISTILLTQFAVFLATLIVLVIIS